MHRRSQSEGLANENDSNPFVYQDILILCNELTKAEMLEWTDESDISPKNDPEAKNAMQVEEMPS